MAAESSVAPANTRQVQLETRLARAEKIWLGLVQGDWNEIGLADLAAASRDLLDCARRLDCSAIADLADEVDDRIGHFVATNRQADRREATAVTVLLTKLRLALVEADGELKQAAEKRAAAAICVVDAGCGSQLAERLRSVGFSVDLIRKGATAKLTADSAPLALLVDIDASGGTPVIASLLEQTGLPIIALAADDGFGLRMEAAAAGGAGFHRKPVDVFALSQQLRALHVGRSLTTRPVILVASENPTFAAELTEGLSVLDVKVESVDLSGRLIQRMLSRSPELVMLDLDMSSLDPATLVRMICQHQELQDTHLMTLTDNGELNREIAAIGGGRLDALRKSQDPERLSSMAAFRLRRLRAQTRRLALHRDRDAITGLYHRAHFLTRLERAVSELDVAHGFVAMMLLRIDNLGQIRQGADAITVDQILQQVSHRLQSVPELGIDVARFDGGGFAVLLIDAEHNALLSLARRARRTLVNHDYQVGQRNNRLEVSIGICVAADHDYLKVLSHAEIACSLARETEREGIHIYQPNADVDRSEEERQNLAEEIVEALQARRFRLAYQPIVSVADNRAERYEVLLRIHSHAGEELPTQAVIEQVKQQHTGITLDRWVIEQSLLKLRERLDHISDTVLFLNVSPVTLRDETLPVWLRRQLQQTPVNPSHLVFEVPELVAEQAPEETAMFMSTVRELGCGCSLERCGRSADFISLIKRLPLDYVKLDPFLAHNMIGNTPKRRYLREQFKELINELQTLDVDVIVAGVEDAKSLSLLWSCGVNFVQGYFLQRPHEELAYDHAEYG